jgi:C-terminal processing protease CtpA/Prc
MVAADAVYDGLREAPGTQVTLGVRRAGTTRNVQLELETVL